MTDLRVKCRELLRRREGLLKLRPTFVPRMYADLNRIGQPRAMRHSHHARTVPERWIASTILANNPPSLPQGLGLSMLHDTVAQETPIALRELIELLPTEMLGPGRAAKHGCFNVLVKLLDPGEAIPLHLHPNDAAVRRSPKRFPKQRYGKDEAYYFFDAAKGPMPYTHAGLRAGVTRKELIAAVRRGQECALELSPSFYQTSGTGFFVPAGVPHRPGTALTLEIQQLSDVSTRLNEDWIARGTDLLNIPLSHQVGEMNGFAIHPTNAITRGGEVASIFPRHICSKFSGDRIRVSTQLKYPPMDSALALLVWRGNGAINDRPVRHGDEFFATYPTARRGLVIQNTGDETLELFAFRPAA